MITTSNIEQAKKEIKSSKKPILVQAQNDNFNRKILEYGKFHALVSIERGDRRNSIRQVDSGLNHVLAKIATKNKIAIAIDLEELEKLPKEKKAKRLEKIKQNIQICKKAKTKIIFLNEKDKKDAFNLLLSLGASTAQAKEAIKFEL